MREIRAEDFINEMTRLEANAYRCGEGLDYMSDMKHWLCVHVTKYEPKRNFENQLYLPTTAMATSYKYNRASTHHTLNKPVASVLGGFFDDSLWAVLAPFNDIVRLNGNPQEVAVDDTYFVPNPDTGLLLPDNTYLIKPNYDKNAKFIVIGDHEITYKADFYTDKEIQAILSRDSTDKKTYEEYLNGQFPDNVAFAILGYNDERIKIYQNSKDKPAFMRGILEEDRFTILNHLLRDAVIMMAMDRMGYNYVYANEDMVTIKVAEVARKNGIRGDSSNKGHSASIEHEFESLGYQLMELSHVFKSKNVVEISDCLNKSRNSVYQKTISNILSDQPIPNLYEIYSLYFEDHVHRIKEYYKTHKMDDMYVSDEVKEIRKKELSKMEKGIKEYCPFLDTVLHRHAKRMTMECNQALKELKKDPKSYNQLKSLLQAEFSPSVSLFLSQSTER